MATTVLAALVAFALGVVATPSVEAQTLNVLYSFTNSGDDGANPYGRLIMDKAGNLYGTTFNSGAGNGTVFKLDTSGQLTNLHSLSGASAAGLVTDKAGNLYGTSTGGGDYGCGTVFNLDTSGQLTNLHSFSGEDGCGPWADLIMDKAGNLYGTTMQGGAYTCGTVFKLDTSGQETVLYSFPCSDNSMLGTVFSGLVMDKAGNLYGTSNAGGAYDWGTVFKLDSSGQLTNLHSFSGGDGGFPHSSLIMDKAGNLYGTTMSGDATSPYGTVFKLDTSGQLTVLHRFSYGDGGFPYACLIMDKAGNLYGTTLQGGANDCGTVFSIDKSGQLTVLHNFSYMDGRAPYAGLILDKANDLYGVTVWGGAYDYGTVFRLTP